TDCLIFWLLSTVTAGLLAVCIVGTQYFMIEGNNFGKLDAARNEGLSHRITETAIDFFMGIVLCGYTVTVYFLWKDHYVMWNRWRRANVNVQLLLSPDSNPVPFVPRSRYNIV
ncbi:E3 ubiquitin-protein ligase MARCH3, partial [Danaus plexippus plexippus]